MVGFPELSEVDGRGGVSLSSFRQREREGGGGLWFGVLWGGWGGGGGRWGGGGGGGCWVGCVLLRKRTQQEKFNDLTSPDGHRIVTITISWLPSWKGNFGVNQLKDELLCPTPRPSVVLGRSSFCAKGTMNDDRRFLRAIGKEKRKISCGLANQESAHRTMLWSAGSRKTSVIFCQILEGALHGHLLARGPRRHHQSARFSESGST